MEASSTYLKLSFTRFLFSCIAFAAILCSALGEAKGQTKKLADDVTYTSPDRVVSAIGCGALGLTPCYAPTVENQGHALVDDDNYARLLASPGLAAGLGAYTGVIELKFENTLPADSWSYVRIAGDNSLFNALLGGSLGELLGQVLGAVLLGNQEIVIDARNGSTSVLSRSSASGFSTDRVKLVVDKVGNYYIAIRPGAAYDRIRITNQTGSLLGLGAQRTLDVYNAFYYDDAMDCLQAQFTSFDGEGLNLNILQSGAGATNIGNAIDDDEDSYSQISTGSVSLGLGNSIYQTIYYDELSAPGDYLRIKLGVANGSAVNARLLGNIEIKAFAGSQEVYAKRLSGGLVNGVDVLGLLQSGQPATIYIGPGVAFDRVTIGYNAIVDVNLLGSAPIHLYDVKRYGATCPEPGAPAPVDDGHMFLDANKDCADNIHSFENANFPYNAVDGHNGTYTTLEAGSGLVLGIGSYTGHIELGFDGVKSGGTTTYVRIDFDNEILSGLLDGSIGDLLSGVTGALFGQHYFTVEVKNGDNPAFLTASSNNGFLNQPVKVVQDKYGHYYVAVTPDQPYDRIRITEHYPGAVGLAGIANMNVYHACVSTGSAHCEQAFATYSESGGISLDLLGLGSAGVRNAHLAIDDDNVAVEDDETFSEIGIGAAGVGASIFQFVDFHTLSSPADYFKIKLGVENGSTLNVQLLNNIEIRAYNGDDLVYSQRLQDGLVAGLDILGLLTTDNVVTIPIGPGVAFDRVAVGINALVELNVLNSPVRVYSIKRFGADCPDPRPLPNDPQTESPFNGPDCGVELGAFEHVNFAYNAIDGHIDTYATLSAGSGIALGIGGSYSGYIELGYDQPVPALETSYVRIDMPDEELLDALVGGSLGSILADLGGIVLFGNHYFDISVRDAAGNEIYEVSSAGGFNSNNARIVRDEHGRYYIAFTADVPYQSVRITLNNTAVAGLGEVTTMNVYSMCRETVFDPCEQATFTSFDGTGLSLNLFEGANPAGVVNPHYVIDENNSNYSELSLGTAAVGAAIYQDVYFKTPVITAATDVVRLRVQVPQTLLNVDLLGAYRVYLYHGNDEVYSATFQNALINGLDLLGLLNSGGRVNVEFEPGAGITYDRVRFEVGSVLGLSIGNPVRLYNIYRISDACPDPEFEQPPFSVCADVIVGEGENVDDIQNLTDGNHNSYATIRSDAGLVAGIGAYSGHVELGFSAVVPAGTSSYIRIEYEDEVLQALLAGSLGNAVNSLLNGIALGDHYFNVIVNDENGNEVVSGSSRDLFDDANGQIRLVQDTKGRYYLEIRPTVAYQSVRLEDHTTALLGVLSSEGHLDVYGMCHTPTTFECPAAFSTSYEGSGLGLDVLNLGGAGVQNAFWAIDQNTSSASTLSLGTLNVLGSIQQNIQFDRVLTAGDQIRIKMKVGTGTLNAALLSTLEVVGYLDGVEVSTRDFEQAFVETNIVDLLNDSDPVEVTVELDTDVDEIAIRLSDLAGVGVAPNVSIYHVIPFCESYAQSYLEVTKNNAWADGNDYNEVTATIIDAGAATPVTNKEVIFTITHVDNTRTTETITTDTEGKARLQLTSTLAGVASVTATVEGMIIADGSPAEVTFIIPNNLSITKVADEATGVTAGESTTFTVTITNDGPAPVVVGKEIPLNERPSEGLTITTYEVTSGNATVSGSGNSAIVTVTTQVPQDGTITLRVTADVAPNAPAVVANGIDVWGPDRDPDTDTPDDSDDTDPIPVNRDYGLDGNITKIAADGTDAVAVAGGAFEYTVTVTNG
ncbi:Ig-like domain-containing protein, partial [Parapedobacter sp. ISTM3]|uniref:Ig-like domain-containing protein n=1 Tax=Parapedobacter sp. ISTM3 TaxID=2800130 RepID=UPI0019079262